MERFPLAALYTSYLFWSPVQAIAILGVGYVKLKWSFVVGWCLLLVVFIPLQIYLGARFAYFRSRIAALTDQRVTFAGQAIRGARVMKMSGFEDCFLERMRHLRQLELAQIRNVNSIKIWNEALYCCTNVVICLSIFIVHVLGGETLSPEDVFTSFTLVNILQLEMIKNASLGVMLRFDRSNSAFLESPERNVQKIQRLRTQTTTGTLLS